MIGMRVAALATTLALVGSGAWNLRKTPSPQPGANDIAGTVTGPEGPEPGVWVIAETNELPTRFVRIVVTDERGRYLIPDLPRATYDVWVRGYEIGRAHV